jgi:hypothetical protein
MSDYRKTTLYICFVIVIQGFIFLLDYSRSIGSFLFVLSKKSPVLNLENINVFYE